jgi:hypothetical protein
MIPATTPAENIKQLGNGDKQYAATRKERLALFAVCLATQGRHTNQFFCPVLISFKHATYPSASLMTSVAGDPDIAVVLRGRREEGACGVERSAHATKHFFFSFFWVLARRAAQARQRHFFFGPGSDLFV